MKKYQHPHQILIQFKKALSNLEYYEQNKKNSQTFKINETVLRAASCFIAYIIWSLILVRFIYNQLWVLEIVTLLSTDDYLNVICVLCACCLPL